MPGRDPAVPRPAPARPAGASGDDGGLDDSELDDAGLDDAGLDLTRTSLPGAGGKAVPAELEAEPGADSGVDLGATIVNVKLQQIPGLVLVAELGRGAAGVVYRGKQEFLDREVAVKMLLEHRQNAEYVARFKREAKLLAGLHHPHIVACYQADVTPDGTCFLVMEYVEGPNLREHLAAHGPLDVVDALRVCRDLAGALECALEQDVIHRDVKSENVLLAPEPRAAAGSKFPWRAKLSDLGLARPQSQDSASTALHLTVEATVMGTPLTMSPEQFDDPLGVDHRTDIYSLGCVLYDMLTALPAFKERTLSALMVAKSKAQRGPDPRADRSGLPPEVAELVGRMLAADREDRPQTYAEVIAACDASIARLGGGAEKALPAPRRGAAPALLAAAGLVAVAAAAAWWLRRDGAAPPAPPELAVALETSGAAREGDPGVLTARVTAAGDAAPRVRFEQVDGPPVALEQDGASARFVAPRAAAAYELAFVAHADAAGRSASSPRTVVRVAADDDPPQFAFGPPAAAREREEVELEARVEDPDGQGTPGEVALAWRQLAGPPVELRADGARVAFTAPESAEPYTVELELEARAGERSWRSAPVVVQVAAANDPPRLALRVPDSVEAGDVVALGADASDPDSRERLAFLWSAAGIAIEGAESLDARFVAPERLPGAAAGDYELEVELAATDGAEPPVRETRRVQVRSDPALDALAPGAEVAWLPAVVGDGLPGWASSTPAPKLRTLNQNEDANDNGVLVQTAEPEAALTRRLPRGGFALAFKLQPQGSPPARKSGEVAPGGEHSSGVRIETRDGDAVCLCFLPKEGGGDERALVAYATRAEGGFPVPAPEKLSAVTTWNAYATIEIELAWNGARLAGRWRDAQGGAWTAFALPELPSRPRSVAVFVRRALLLVGDVAIRGA